MASLDKLQKNWESYAQADPLWAICTDRAKRGGRWTKDEFFATGDREIGKIMEYLRSQGLSPDRNTAALDFGCGVGRLTQALSQYFDECSGVDISPTMIQLAKSFHSANPRCSFFLNPVDDLRQFPDGHFGFIYTSITLQHIPKHCIRGYLLELIRVLTPGGIFVFQVLDKSRILQKVKRNLRSLQCYANRLLGRNGVGSLKMEMNCISENEIRQLFSGYGVSIVDVRFTNSTDRSFNGDIQFVEQEPNRGHISKQYCVVKDEISCLPQPRLDSPRTG
jgi:SAM-dependent methyltransferase